MNKFERQMSKQKGYFICLFCHVDFVSIFNCSLETIFYKHVLTSEILNDVNLYEAFFNV